VLKERKRYTRGADIEKMDMEKADIALKGFARGTEGKERERRKALYPGSVISAFHCKHILTHLTSQKSNVFWENKNKVKMTEDLLKIQCSSHFLLANCRIP